MKLTKISATNLMVASFELALDALTFITGKNFSGKTRVATAIKLALLGHRPGLDKTGPGTFWPLASGNPMEVRAQVARLEDGAGVVIERIHRKWEEGFGKVKTMNHVPEELDGRTPVAMMDASEYFQESAKGRIEMIFKVAKIEGGSVEEIIEEVEARIGPEFAGKLPAAGWTNVQEWLEKASEAAEKHRSLRAAEARMLSGTLQGNTALSNERQAAQREISAIDQDIEKAVSRLAELRTEHENIKKSQDQFDSVTLERETLQAELDAAGGPPTREYDIDALRAKCGALRARIKAEEEKATAYERWAQGETEHQQKIEAATERLAEAQKKKPHQTVEPFTCAHCGEVVGKSKASKQRIVMARGLAIKNEIDMCARDLARLVELPRVAAPERGEDVAVDRAELEQVEAEIDAYTRDAKLSAMAMKLKALPEVKDQAPRLLTIEEEIEQIRPRLDLLRAERRQAEMDRADRQRLAEAKQKHEEAEAAEKRWKAVKALLIERKGKLIEAAFRPLLETAAALTSGILLMPFEYRAGEFGYRSRNCLEGRNIWVSEKTFSGTEQALLYAALQCALGAQSPCRIIIVDELGRMDDQVARQFLHNVQEAQKAGLFEQFIAISPRDLTQETIFPETWTIIEARENQYVPRGTTANA